MIDRLFPLLSRDAAGFAIAVVPGVAASAMLAAGAAGIFRALAWILLLAAAALAAGSLRHLVAQRRIAREFPAPGCLVDAGGFRMHLLAEGKADGRATVVLLPGGHGAGAAMHHLHRALRGDTRSILVDRAGTGWSDAGPFPRTTAREAEETVAALTNAGEPGPFLLIGHSFGGLLAANIARRRPDLTAGVMLLDATPPDTITYGPRLGALRQMRRDALVAGIARLFGIDYDPSERRMAGNPQVDRIMRTYEACIGPAWPAYRALGRTARSYFASASIYRELTPAGMANAAWETVVYDGDLGALPVWLVAPQDLIETQELPELDAAGASEALRMQRFFARNRERYLAVSSRSERVVAPKGSGHNFPYEAAEFTIATIRRALGPG